MTVALAEVPMTRVRDDPYVHFGDVLQLLHVSTNSVLSVDVEAKVRGGERLHQVCDAGRAGWC